MTLTAPAPLADHHDLAYFRSGVPVLDDWLRKRARTNQANGASRTYVVCDGDNRVIAYYALAAGGVRLPEAPSRFRRNMPDPIPVAVLGRLAVDEAYHGRGLGRALVSDAGLRLLNAADVIGVRGMIVHALSEDAKAFYLALGFTQSPLDSMTLMVSSDDLKKALP